MCRHRSMQGRIFMSLVVLTSAALFTITTSAQAGTLIGVGGEPPMGPFTGTEMIMVGSTEQPIPIVPDPNAPPWMKQFVIERQGIGWPGPPPEGQPPNPGNMVGVMETIVFGPSTFPGSTAPIHPIDWHEDIDPTVGDGANFKWTGGSIEIPAGSGTSYPGEVGPDGKSIWFNFPPVPPGTPIKINKQLMWNGGVVTGSDPDNTYIIKINERPSIPEPTSLMLASVVLAGAMVLRRRSR
ncbi:MAG: PEP-CTERM sorting domain-containing protein [Pirellulales bacterium]